MGRGPPRRGRDGRGRAAARGPARSPLGAAVLPADRRVYKIRDSKMLTEREREALFERIAGWCAAWAVGHASHRECDELGMSEAQRLAARRAIDGLGVVPDRVLVDGNWDFVGGGITRTHRAGRRRPACRSPPRRSWPRSPATGIMRAEAEHYPGYDFEWNKGYPCPRHKMALQGHRARPPSTGAAGCSWTTCRGPGRSATSPPTAKASCSRRNSRRRRGRGPAVIAPRGVQRRPRLGFASRGSRGVVSLSISANSASCVGGVAGEVFAFGEVGPDQADGVLGGAALPGRVPGRRSNTCEVGGRGERPVVGHFFAVVPGQ